MRPFHSTMLLAPMRRIYAIDLVFVRGFILLTALVIAVLGGVGAGQPFNRANQAEQAKLGKLGTVNFPTSCSQLAQARFLRGGRASFLLVSRGDRGISRVHQNRA